MTGTLKLLFLTRHFSYLRNFESAVVALAERGHRIHLAAEREETVGGREMVERLAARFPNVTFGMSPTAQGPDAKALRHLRLGTDALRFLDARYTRTPHLRTRALERAPRRIVELSRRRVFRRPRMRRVLADILRWVERGAPPPSTVEAYLREQAPDVVLLTPLVDLGSPQLDAFTAARRLGLRTVLCVGSWDHLSSKALLRATPDLVTVWNDIQKREAVEMHGVPAERVAVTGAQAYDHWFDWRPSRTREEFCARVGLPPDRPFILYVCSSLFRGTGHEPVFVEKWIRAVRAAEDETVRSAGILVRPHPSRLEEWHGVDLSPLGHVAFWGAHPIDDRARADYFDSMHYAAAVVGLNTSAFLEAGVLGKSVFTVLLPKYSRHNQEGTIHFHYLLEAGGGLLHVARGFPEHVEQLRERLALPGDVPDEKSRRFTDAFIRPFGRSESSTARFVDAVERAGRAPAPPPQRAPSMDAAARRFWPNALAWLDLAADVERPKTAVGSSRPAAARRRPDGPPAIKTSSLAPKVRKARAADRHLAGMDTPVARETRALVEQLGASEQPVIAGPWISEAGFELIYWVPFLRWVCRAGRIDPRRVLVISRGGSAPWYQPFAAEYEDILVHFTPDEFRVRTADAVAARGGRLKHAEVSVFDREILARVKQRRGLLGAELLHPSLMYRLFDDFWMQREPMSLVDAFTEFALVPESPHEAAIRSQLPERYVCAKFYANTALPDTPENRAFVASTIERLAEAGDVVLLHTGVKYDDHEEYPRSLRGRIHTIEHLMAPPDNLAVQTAVIRGAQAYVGTYGGFSYLAPLCGTGAVTFYSHPDGFRFDHLEVAKRVFAGLRGGAFVEVDLRAVDAVRLAFAAPGLAGIRG